MRALAGRALPADRVVVPGVTAVAMWKQRRCGSILFCCKADSKVQPFAGSALQHVDGKRLGLWWVGTGGGGVGLHTRETEEPGLRKLGGSSDDRFRTFIGSASEEVTAIRLQQGDRVWTTAVGHDGYVFLGARATESAIIATAITASGRRIGNTHSL